MTVARGSEWMRFNTNCGMALATNNISYETQESRNA
jgi:hypothetical protein